MIAITTEASCPVCPRCGVETSLFGIENHPAIEGLELHTYMCRQCEVVLTESVNAAMAQATPMEWTMHATALLENSTFDSDTTQLLGAAFETAWQRVQASGSMHGHMDQAGTTRELLAEGIIWMAQQGERDPNRLVEAALGQLVSRQTA